MLGMDVVIPAFINVRDRQIKGSRWSHTMRGTNNLISEIDLKH